MTSTLPTADATATFRELGVSAAAAGALEKRGYDTPLPVQAMVLPDILEGRDILAKSPTGSGKTLAFMVPLLDCLDANTAPRPAALVLAPTRELASQIVDESSEVAHALALRVTAVYGGVGLQRQARDAARSHVIVATPGRLEDLLARGAFKLDQVEILVLDEADRMLDMGFKPAIDRIVKQTPDDRQTLFFSATLDGEAGKIAEAFTVEAARHEHAPPERPITEMEHRFIDTRGGDKVNLLLDVLEQEERGLAIVFVRTKHGADRLARRLDQAGVNAGAMHGGKTQGQRERALSAFERGKIDVLVATDVAARGIDIDDITHVINYDAPEDREAYVHRIGRTGRAGRTGTGMTFVAPDQVGDVAEIVRELGLEERYEAAGLDSAARAGGKKKKGGSQGGGPRGGGRPQGGGYGQRDDRGPRGGGERGGYGQRRDRDDRAPRGEFRGRDDRAPRSDRDDRGPRGGGGGYGQRDDRGPRGGGGGYGQRDDRGPRGGGGGYGQRDDRGPRGGEAPRSYRDRDGGQRGSTTGARSERRGHPSRNEGGQPKSHQHGGGRRNGGPSRSR